MWDALSMQVLQVNMYYEKIYLPGGIRSLVKFGQNSLSLLYHCKSLFIHCIYWAITGGHFVWLIITLQSLVITVI